MTFKEQVIESIEIPENAQKIVLFLDQQGLNEIQPQWKQFARLNNRIEAYLLMNEKNPLFMKEKIDQLVPIEFSFAKVITEETVQEVLSNQTIGTYLLLGCDSELVRTIKRQAIEIGFSEQEMRLLQVGEKKEKLFCVKCYHYNNLTDEHTVVCNHCQTKLDVSEHYSRVKEAYLGYIAI
ncbi:dimethylamine monooxygenase subunit DmmA family protein [Aquibacillus albus]|uniref:Uncharacterized protein YjgD (DUF1641 family) n=1 Tax=Aquibacillus albus TaxID=1168171 RepID=A0ABS2MWB8_9BACI|nr:dimethylamine monooxygenase subunit DmmA family protein [Aquibacillus albus]MBM7570189.1 uncharacterized protein YjgD (DUF1641 family) [Aquibacillus albus]